MTTPAASCAPTVPSPAGTPPRRVSSPGVTRRLAATSLHGLTTTSQVVGATASSRAEALYERATGGEASRQPTDVIVVSSRTATASSDAFGSVVAGLAARLRPDPGISDVRTDLGPGSRLVSAGAAPRSSNCGRRPTPTSSRSSPPCRPPTARTASLWQSPGGPHRRPRLHRAVLQRPPQGRGRLRAADLHRRPDARVRGRGRPAHAVPHGPAKGTEAGRTGACPHLIGGTSW
jgi:hypothetical protein